MYCLRREIRRGWQPTFGSSCMWRRLVWYKASKVSVESVASISRAAGSAWRWKNRTAHPVGRSPDTPIRGDLHHRKLPGFVWLKIGSSSALLWTPYLTSEFQSMRANSITVGWLSTSRVGLCWMQLVAVSPHVRSQTNGFLSVLLGRSVIVNVTPGTSGSVSGKKSNVFACSTYKTLPAGLESYLSVTIGGCGHCSALCSLWRWTLCITARLQWMLCRRRRIAWLWGSRLFRNI